MWSIGSTFFINTALFSINTCIACHVEFFACQGCTCCCWCAARKHLVLVSGLCYINATSGEFVSFSNQKCTGFCTEWRSLHFSSKPICFQNDSVTCPTVFNINSAADDSVLTCEHSKKLPSPKHSLHLVIST